MTQPRLPLPVGPLPDLLAPEFEPLLAEPVSAALAADDEASAAAGQALRPRLMARVGAARQAADAMVTARCLRLKPRVLAPGVQLRELYAASGGIAVRPGEPLRAWLIELAAGSSWAGPAADTHREWLVLRGELGLGDELLGLRDYHVAPTGCTQPPWRALSDAVLFLRESALPAEPGDRAHTVRDTEAGWPDYAPGIRRRVLWQRDGQAAMLYHTEPGASVPLHRHGHDEECLMVQGELYLDDVLLQAGDYQLAPAGTQHRITETDTGVVIYAHGDLDLQFLPAEPGVATT